MPLSRVSKDCVGLASCLGAAEDDGASDIILGRSYVCGVEGDDLVTSPSASLAPADEDFASAAVATLTCGFGPAEADFVSPIDGFCSSSIGLIAVLRVDLHILSGETGVAVLSGEASLDG